MQCDLKHLSYLRFIVYYQYFCFTHNSATLIKEVFTGIDITNLDPFEFVFSSSTFPDIASVNPFTIERPKPELDAFKFLERENLLNTSFISTSVKPLPVSSITMFNISTGQVTEISILEFDSVCMAALLNKL